MGWMDWDGGRLPCPDMSIDVAISAVDPLIGYERGFIGPTFTAGPTPVGVTAATLNL